MPKGFFSASKLKQIKTPESKVMQCGACGLKKTCLSPIMLPSGEGRKRILIVAEAPGKEEDKQGIQLVGNSGRELEKILRENGISMRKDCILDNAIICRPPNNKTPDANQLDYCRPHIKKTLDKYDPEIVITLGGPATQTFLKPYWGENPGPISKWTGWRIPHIKTNRWICPLNHPSYLLRVKDSAHLYTLFRKQLRRILKLQGRPHDNPPDYRSQIELIHSPTQAARAVKEIIRRGGLSAFDYETNMLKPDGEKAAIYSVAICWEGEWTIAFPWQGVVIEWFRKYLKSRKCSKIAGNMKFEKRWSRAIVGCSPASFWEDCVIGSHSDDPREGTSGVKFQAFVTLGVDPYSRHLENMLRAKTASTPNRIHEIDINDLLLYNGLDALLEFWLAVRQARKLKIPRPKVEE